MATFERDHCVLNRVLSRIIIAVIFLLSLKITASPTTEAQALVKWKNSLLYTPLLNSWSPSNIHNLCSSWDAIVCDKTTNKTVSRICLSGLNLSGTLHGLDFASLPNFTLLDLNDNRSLSVGVEKDLVFVCY
ncbi:hypothetical protein S83_025844 [Arachis hypogaea]|nr:uncharacterized protein DS421_8g238880 [Arachis hypogaea]